MSENITIDPDPLSIKPQNPLYTLQKAKLDNKRLLAKCFYSKQVLKAELLDSLQFNQTVFTNPLEQFAFPQHILPIKRVCQIEDGSMFLTEEYKETLSEYIKNKFKPEEKQAKEIFQQIVKAVYSIYQAGYWSRNIRLEHFVKVKKLWKIQSLVLEEKPNPQYPSEYVTHPQFLPFQALEKDKSFTQQELQNRMVWDLGAILIHLLLGNHKLTNQRLNKFKNSQFSFTKIQAEIGEKFDPQLKKHLGRMCHHNYEKRMKIEEFFKLQYFSKEVSTKFKEHLKNKEKNNSKLIFSSRVYAPGMSNIRSSISGGKIDQLNIKRQKIPDEVPEVIEVPKVPEEKKITLQKIIKPKILTEQLQRLKRLRQQLQKIIQIKQFNFLEPQLLNPLYLDILEIFLSERDKCHLLQLDEKKYLQISDSYEKNKKRGVQVSKFTQFLLTFTSAVLLKELQKKSTIYPIVDKYGISHEHFQNFTHDWSYTFNHLKQLAHKERLQAQEKLKIIKEKLWELPQPHLIINQKQYQQFIRLQTVEKSKFNDFKQMYRKFMFYKVYGGVVRKFNQTKLKEDAQLCLMLTFSLAIDKMYIPKQIHLNFENFMKWKGSQGKWIQAEEYRNYVKESSQQQLVKDSNFIVSTYYDYQ